MATGRIRIGLSGWAYKHWRSDFYPPDLRQADELSYAAARFPTLEINRTFYSLVEPRNMRDWHDHVPPDFEFAVKGSRFITHNKKLGDIEEPMARFVASGLIELKDKLGPILWQLGPNHRFDRDRVDRFMAALPKKLGNRRLRHVIEPRHETFFVPDLARIAREHNVAIAFSHSSRWPYTEEVTAGFVYIRLHGPRELYSSAYSRRELVAWGQRIEAWASGSEPDDGQRLTDLAPPPRKRPDVYVYFDNDSGGHAPRQALELINLLGSSRTAG
ncbi:MAG TPA: DUF72 domain-containing protein [Acidimicrobiia bacterium]|jgi:uncharacterized protein YecE (DUF72 family)|nr:DUF72 domain-containing protein [Acidimicrobiia bacterium]